MDMYLIMFFCVISIALIGGVGTLLWQSRLSRDKQLNQKAQLRALDKESKGLRELRQQQSKERCFQAHYAVLGDTKAEIQAVNQKIDVLFEKKLVLIQSYEKLVHEASSYMILGFEFFSSKKTPKILTEHFEQILETYEKELSTLQTHRAGLWDMRADFQKHLLDEEKVRNDHLDNLYHEHTALLEKVYLGQLESTDAVNKASIEAGTQSLQSSIFYPLQFLTSFFSSTKKTDVLKKVVSENQRREMVSEVEKGVNTDVTLDMNEGLLTDYL
ncbi:MAG: hypothetical protein P1U32_01400 [Legionellaceae bacterium]|nr:hypothetical protein [Legionellaceae bacterium]